jgi:hypothetical protein
MIKLESKFIENIYNNEKLFSKSALHGWYKPPRVENIYQIDNYDPIYTLVVPVFNQEYIIGDFLKAHLNASSLTHNIYFIFDSCSDNSIKEFRNFIENFKLKNVNCMVEFITDVPFFETACDNIGFYFAETPYIIETQPDIHMMSANYDRRLLSVLDNPKVSCVSGRCGHSLSLIYPKPKGFKNLIHKFETNSVGLCGTNIQTEGTMVDDSQNTAYFCETVNRGPIAFRRQDLVDLNYLDQDNFFLGNDDHDLNLRNYLLTGRLPAYIPLRIDSKLQWGSTRKERDPMNARVFKSLQSRPDYSALKRFSSFYRPYQSIEAFNFKNGFENY